MGRSQRHLRYYHGLDSATETAEFWGEPSWVPEDLQDSLAAQVRYDAPSSSATLASPPIPSGTGTFPAEAEVEATPPAGAR